MAIDLTSVFQIPLKIHLDQDDFSVPIGLLPKQTITGDLKPSGSRSLPPRCRILYGPLVNRGQNGTIHRITRSPSTGVPLCVKAPTNADFSLCPEALLQSIAERHLKEYGVHGAIPAVIDIFQMAGETRFSMEFIEGMSAVDALLVAPNPDEFWLQILAQAALLLGFLEEKIHLDHRDLKADNLWIRRTPIDYTLPVGGSMWHLRAPFQVVILDFGFACLGDDDGNAAVSLSDGVLPKLDPCPKEGRDLFQLVASMWSIPQIRRRIGPELSEDTDRLLKHRNANYLDLVKRTTTPYWIYLAVSDLRFRHPPLSPCSLLQMLSHEWYPTVDLVGVCSP